MKIYKGKKSSRFVQKEKLSIKQKIDNRIAKNRKKFFAKYGKELEELIIENED